MHLLPTPEEVVRVLQGEPLRFPVNNVRLANGAQYLPRQGVAPRQ